MAGKCLIEEMTIKTNALKTAGITVTTAYSGAQSGLRQDRGNDHVGMGEICRRRRRGDPGGVQEISASARSIRFIASRCGLRPSAWSRSR